MKRILLIEDNKDTCHLMKFFLEKKGYEVIVSMNGREGIRLARTKEPDLILMDILLPDISGEEATKEIRKALGGEVPILAITAHAMAGDRERFLSSGHDGYIQKPINPDSFIKEIERFV